MLFISRCSVSCHSEQRHTEQRQPEDVIPNNVILNLFQNLNVSESPSFQVLRYLFGFRIPATARIFRAGHINIESQIFISTRYNRAVTAYNMII